MPTLPVDGKILEDALEVLYPTGAQYRWVVGSTVICCRGHHLWHSTDGFLPCSEKGMQTALEHLLKSRAAGDFTGWYNMSKDERNAIRREGRQKTGCLWPSDATSGAEYVEACAWYDRVEAELAGVDERQHLYPNIPNQTLMDALNFAMHGGWSVSNVYITRHGHEFWNPEVGACGDEDFPGACRLVRLLTQTRPPVDGPQVDVSTEVYDAGLKFAGITSTRHTDYPAKAQTGEQYLRWCAFEDHCLAAITDADSPNDELAEVKEAWSGLIPGAAKLTDSVDVDPLHQRWAEADDVLELEIRQNNEQHRINLEKPEHAPEQPWERDKRVAASAGYAHVAAEETDHWEQANHGCRMQHIEAGHGGFSLFAHTQPADQLTGTRTDALGWATHGHAVTEARGTAENAADMKALYTVELDPKFSVGLNAEPVPFHPHSSTIKTQLWSLGITRNDVTQHLDRTVNRSSRPSASSLHYYIKCIVPSRVEVGVEQDCVNPDKYCLTFTADNMTESMEYLVK